MWIDVISANDERHLINTDTIVDVQYFEDTNLSAITFVRSAFPSLYVRGNILIDIKKALLAEKRSVHRIGEQHV